MRNVDVHIGNVTIINISGSDLFGKVGELIGKFVRKIVKI